MPTLADVRDLFIVMLALESLVVVGLLIWLIIELRGLMRVLRDELKPILTSAQETVRTVRGTTTFVSENIVAPVVKLSGFVAGARAVVGTLMGRNHRK
ncbi:MAG: hypothetical protein HY259_12725 [Chloroflexi bacterium]|nr:hypothetical protein [Chloroflexota bacterium]